MKLYILLSIIYSVSARYDIPKELDFGAHYRPVTFSCFKKDPECLLVGIEKSDCTRNGGLLADCRDIYALTGCQACYVEDVEVYRYVAFATVDEWCKQHDALASKFKSSPICKHY